MWAEANGEVAGTVNPPLTVALASTDVPQTAAV